MIDYNDMPKTQMDRLQRDRRAVQHKAIRDAEHRVAEAALKVEWQGWDIWFAREQDGQEFLDATNDLRRLKGEG